MGIDKKLSLFKYGLVTLLVIGVSAGVYFVLKKENIASFSGGRDITIAVKELQQIEGSSADTSHIANGVLPPTNSWISGAVLQKDPKPVFPMPLSLKLLDTSYEVGLPKLSVTDKTITAPHIPAITATIDTSSSMKLSRFDKVSATLQYADASGAEIGKLTVASGVPYTFYRASEDHIVNLTTQKALSIKSDKAIEFIDAGNTYSATISGSGTFTSGSGVASAKLQPKDLLTIMVVPTQLQSEAKTTLGSELKNVKTSYRRVDNRIITTLQYETDTSEPLFIGRVTKDLDGSSGSYDTLYGTLPVAQRNRIEYSVPYVPPSSELNSGSFTKEERNSLKAQLVKDVATTKVDKTDTYFSGKQLARAANLLTIAKQVGDDPSARKLIDILRNAFSEKTGKRYFYYDSQLKGVAPYEAAFGAEDFNDHHFHYGYFLYAASIVAKYDDTFIDDYGSNIDLLAADIATQNASNLFPETRNYDPYAGHSWAAGLAPFADGNNQESSSEAIHAWNGVALWGRVTNNSSLLSTGEALLANESASARDRWRDVNVSGYTKPLVVLNWGGKRDYATFFSDEPGVKLGIQLIPMDPSMTVALKDSPEIISKLVNGSIGSNNFNVALGDYGLMYFAFDQPEKAYQLAKEQQDRFIDDGNSRTYLYAWIFAQ